MNASVKPGMLMKQSIAAVPDSSPFAKLDIRRYLSTVPSGVAFIFSCMLALLPPDEPPAAEAGSGAEYCSGPDDAFASFILADQVHSRHATPLLR